MALGTLERPAMLLEGQDSETRGTSLAPRERGRELEMSHVGSDPITHTDKETPTNTLDTELR